MLRQPVYETGHCRHAHSYPPHSTCSVTAISGTETWLAPRLTLPALFYALSQTPGRISISMADLTMNGCGGHTRQANDFTRNRRIYYLSTHSARLIYHSNTKLFFRGLPIANLCSCMGYAHELDGCVYNTERFYACQRQNWHRRSADFSPEKRVCGIRITIS